MSVKQQMVKRLNSKFYFKFSANKKKIDIVTENDNFEDELDQMNENLMNKMEMLKLSEKELDAI
tara:strand:- start:506 stop:697 length:192 start_codon:yes stop_codon:yes gene_type:complete